MNEYDGKSILDELKEEMEALKLRIAFAEIDEKEIEAWLGTPSAYSNEGMRRAEKAITEGLRKRRLSRFFRKTLPHGCQAVAAVLLIFFIGLSTAVATVQSVRVKVLSFIMSIEQEYTALGFDDSDGIFMDVPEGWNGSYFPSFIPDGFAFAFIDSDMGWVRYESDGEKNLQFSEYTYDTYTNIDTEDSQMRFVPMHGGSALVSEKGGHVFIAWAIDNRFFVVSLDGTADTAIKIAESVRMIK